MNPLHRDSARLAILDVDGTLYPGALGIELLRSLIAGGVCDRDRCQPVFDVLQQYRTGGIDFATMSVRAYSLFAASLKDCACTDVDRVARQTWHRERARLFPFASELVRLLEADGCVPVLISGSPEEMVRLLAAELGIARFCGASFSRDGGVYTGEVELASAVLGTKQRILSALVAGRAVRWQESLAMGDSPTDAGLFELVGIPIAFEPDPGLRSLALQRGWTVADRTSVLDTVRALLRGNP